MTSGPFTPPEPLDPRLRRTLAVAAATLALAEARRADTRAPALATLACIGPQRDATVAAVVAWAEAEGVSALIAPSLASLAPAALAEGLADTARRVAERAAVLAADRAHLAAALRTEGVPWRPLKGAWLADHAYPDPALRPMADTDAWVPPTDMAAAARALGALGYRCAGVSWKHAVYQRPGERVVDMRGEHAHNPRPIDVHQRMLEGFRGIVLDVGALHPPGEAAPPRRAGTSGARWPDPAAMLIHVAAHACVDALGRRLRLLSLVDVGVLAAAAGAATWRRVAELAAAPHVARFVWPALELASRDLAAPVPPWVRTAIGAHVRRPLQRWVAGIALDDITRPGGAAATRPLLEIPHIWPLDRREAAIVVRWIVWPPRAALADRYPELVSSARWPLAYARHIADSWHVARGRWQRRPHRR